jgi:hypothetical protein
MHYGGTQPSAVRHFVDRETESAALRAALEEHAARSIAGEIDGKECRNVVTYYGMGGIGKSELSQRLERWLVEGGHDDWGAPPVVGHLVVARWELNDSRGNLDLIPLMLAVRDALHAFKKSWPAFDLAFAAYHTAVRPNQELRFGRAKDSEFVDGFTSLLGAIAEDVGATNVVAGLASGGVRTIVRQARKVAKKWAATQTNPDIGDLLARCLNDPGDGNQLPELAAEVLHQLSLEIDAMEPGARPNLVVFVDHFERVQGAVRGRGEYAINLFVTSLPYALFVISGRNEVDWYRPTRLDLAAAGPLAWPSLVQGRTDGARQHLLDRLSDEDTMKLLVRHRDLEGFRVSDEVLAEVVASTAGWPVHIDAVAEYARRLREIDPDREITREDLGGSLDTVVANLIDDLPDDERRVFQAACLLPFFDVDLVRAVAGSVESGAVHRFLMRALVHDNLDSAFPYRIHDAIRAAVRGSTTDVRSGWATVDWREAAARALDYAHGLFDAATAVDDDSGQLMATALAINIAAENDDVDPGWIPTAITKGPSHGGLTPFIPASTKVGPRSKIRPAIEFLELLASRATDETVERLTALGADPVIGEQAALFAAYRMRYPLFRYNDAITRFGELVDMFPHRAALYRRQIAVTLTQARRFAAAREAAAMLEETPRQHLQHIVDRYHGDLSAIDALRARVASISSSRRYQIEIFGTQTINEARLGVIHPNEVVDRLQMVRRIGHRSAERDMLKSFGLFQLFRSELFDEVMATLEDLKLHRGESPAEAELLVLRSLATHRREFAERAMEIVEAQTWRSGSWIPTEIYLESLGFTVPPIETEWDEPYDVVTGRWMKVAEGIVDRAGEYA